MMRVRFPLPAPNYCADIAQLVERTLGKGEVGSSNLPISTILYSHSLQLRSIFILMRNDPWQKQSLNVQNRMST